MPNPAVPPAPTALRGLLPFLRPYRWPIAAALLFLVLAAGATLLFPLALRSLIDQGLLPATREGQTLALGRHFGGLFAVATALALFSAARFYTVSWLGERIAADLRQAVYAHVIRQSPAYFETTQTGEVLSRLSSDTTLVQTVVGSSLSMGLRNAVMGLGALGMLVWTHPYLMGQVVLALALVVAPSVLFGRRVRRLSRASQDRIADASAMAAEVLNAIPVVQANNAIGHEARRFEQATQQAFETATRRSRARSVLVAFVILASSAALLWGLYEGTQAVLQGRLSPGELGQTVVYVLILASASAVLGEVYGDLLRAAGATERLMELLHRPSAPDSGTHSPQASAQSTPAAIEFEAVTFCYPSRPQHPALQDFSLSIAPGETVALVGGSGAGKSTVLQLLQRFQELPSGGGQIRLDGTALPDWTLDALRAQMGVVPQDAVIFSASALDNIRYGRPEASPAEVEAAARLAHADEFIQALPEGYATHLGERGVRLSGGQRQRLSIARALLRRPRVLLLDEATSALDAESERLVQTALEAALHASGQRTHTTLVIAHRLATVQRADRIVVMDQGRIVEQGRHEELMAHQGIYARLAALQWLQ